MAVGIHRSNWFARRVLRRVAGLQMRRLQRTVAVLLWLAAAPGVLGDDPPPAEATPPAGQAPSSGLWSQITNLVAPGTAPSEAPVTTAPAESLPPPDEASAAPPSAPSDGPESDGALHNGEHVVQQQTGLLDVHVRDTGLATVLEMLSYETQTNIVTSKSVGGAVSANLYNVTLEEALEALLVPNNLVFQQRGRTIFVGTPEELAVSEPAPESRVFRLKYIRPSEAAAAVRGLLGPESSVIEGGGKEGAGEIAGASSDYLIVKDQPARLAAVATLLAEIDQRPRQVLIESTILRATLNENNQFGIDFTLLSGVDFQNVSATSTAGADLTLGALPASQLQDATVNIRTGFAQNVPDGGFNFGLVRDNIGVFVRALEEVTDVVVVANPKVVALNKQESNVIVGRRDGYITTTVTDTAAVQTVDFLETGTQIRFTPLINEDGSVRLHVHPKDSNGGLNAANLPFEETTEAQADILMRDGNTVLIGGLFRERTVNNRSQLPGLGNVPILGLLMSNRNDTTVREEVIILLTVHILKEDEAEQAHFRSLLDDVERIRVGTRMGLLHSGRERLAQAFYHEAVRRLEKGDRDLALLNARMTLHNQPQHAAATRLIERLEGERFWEEEGTRMHTFILELIGPPAPTPWPQPAFDRPDVRPYLPATADQPEEQP